MPVCRKLEKLWFLINFTINRLVLCIKNVFFIDRIKTPERGILILNSPNNILAINESRLSLTIHRFLTP